MLARRGSSNGGRASHDRRLSGHAATWSRSWRWGRGDSEWEFGDSASPGGGGGGGNLAALEELRNHPRHGLSLLPSVVRTGPGAAIFQTLGLPELAQAVAADPNVKSPAQTQGARMQFSGLGSLSVLEDPCWKVLPQIIMALQQSSQDLNCKGRQAGRPVAEEGLLFAQDVQEGGEQEGRAKATPTVKR